MAMGLMKEFKEFAVKGNALDMAVGIIIAEGMFSAAAMGPINRYPRETVLTRPETFPIRMECNFYLYS